MSFRTVMTVASVLFLVSIVSLCAAPQAAWADLRRGSPESNSVAGKISNVNGSQFTLNLSRNQTPSKLDFVIDSDTKVEGTLVVGAQATVDYRGEGDRLIATHIVVLPASGFRPY